MKKKEVLIPLLLAILLTGGGIFYRSKSFECWWGGTFLGFVYICNQSPPLENNHYYFLATILLLNFLIIFILYQLVKWVRRKR